MYLLHAIEGISLRFRIDEFVLQLRSYAIRQTELACIGFILYAAVVRA